MKSKILKSVMLIAFVLSLSTAAFAQPASAAPAQTKAGLYEKFLADYKGSAEQQKSAYETSKMFLAKFGGTDDEYTKFVRKWNEKYEKATLEFNFIESLVKKNHADVFRYGKELLAAEPERLDVLIRLSRFGLVASVEDKIALYDADTVAYARQAIKLIEAGKQPEKTDATGKKVADWDTLKTKEDTLGALKLVLGTFETKAKNYRESATLFRAALRRELFAKDPITYVYLANAYYLGEVKTNFGEYKKLLEKDRKSVTLAELDAAQDKYYKSLDLMIDAYARAVALSTDPNAATNKKFLTEFLTPFYKSRHNDSEAGLPEYIGKVLSTPLPEPVL